MTTSVPSTNEPTAARPATTDPSTVASPAAQPAAALPSTNQTPANQTPANLPPAARPAAAQPAVSQPSVAQPPLVQTPAVEPLAVEPLPLEPSLGEPLAVEPLPLEPSLSEPLAVQPSATEPPVTQPRAAAAAGTQADASQPPAEELPTAPPPAAELPAILPPAAESAAAQPPAAQSPTLERPVTPPSVFQRFNLAQRVEHVLAISSFTVLAVTGLPQEFAAQAWAQAMIGFFGGIEATRDIHHFAAIVLMLEVVWHVIGVGYRLYVLRTRFTMLPGIRDVTDAWGTFLYNVGLGKQRPPTGRYSFEEKIEYWAFVWGAVIMAITGFMMWNPIATTHLLPGEIIPAAKAAHGNEALLAVLAIIVWHLYSVHIRRFNKSMWTGKLTEAEMRAEHPLELADIQAGRTQPPLDPVALKHRQRIFYPVAGVLALVFVFGIYEFATFETTAVDTVPLRVVQEAQVQAFVPVTPTPLPAPQLSPVPASLKPIWAGNIELLLANNCSTCHSHQGGLGGLDLTSYQSTLAGGQDGAVVQPGDAAHSLIVSKISAGTHPGKINASQLSVLKAWITAGTPEK